MSDLAMMSGQIDYQGEWGGMVRPADRRMARFENVPTQNMVRTEAEGRPIFENKVVLFVRHPGERDETAVAMQPHHKYEFPRQWAAFEAGQRPEADGTPLSILFPTDPAIVKHMSAVHVFTVEQLADLTAEGKRRIGMGVDDYVRRAQQYLEHAEKAAPQHQMEAALRQRDDEIAALKEQVAMLAEAATRRRGRAANQGDE